MTTFGLVDGKFVYSSTTAPVPLMSMEKGHQSAYGVIVHAIKLVETHAPVPSRSLRLSANNRATTLLSVWTSTDALSVIIQSRFNFKSMLTSIHPSVLHFPHPSPLHSFTINSKQTFLLNLFPHKSLTIDTSD